jgi:hypothetical protein
VRLPAWYGELPEPAPGSPDAVRHHDADLGVQINESPEGPGPLALSGGNWSDMQEGKLGRGWWWRESTTFRSFAKLLAQFKICRWFSQKLGAHFAVGYF